MSGWRYKWVSAILGGEPDHAAARKAVQRGWAPVAPGDMPDMAPPFPDRPDAFRLYRQPDAEVRKTEARLTEMNLRLADPAYHVREANRRVAAGIAELPPRADGQPVNHGWSPIEGSGTHNDARRMIAAPRAQTVSWREDGSTDERRAAVEDNFERVIREKGFDAFLAEHRLAKNR